MKAGILVLSVLLSAPTWGAPFHVILERQGVRFEVTCPNEGSLNPLTIRPFGLKVDNSPIQVEADGSVTGARVADLDGNGHPELYVFTTSAGSGSYGAVMGYASNNGKSLSAIFLPPLDEDKPASVGYRGRDSFDVTANRLVRRFPVYRDGDANARPTSGKVREVHYRLVKGEATWVLRRDRITDLPVATAGAGGASTPRQ